MVRLLSLPLVASVLVWAQSISAANLRRAQQANPARDVRPEPEDSTDPTGEKGPCHLDLIEVCNLPYPTTYQGIFDARMCLWGNRDKITKECLQYLLHDSPSVIEPCYEPIAQFCGDVVPGDNRVHNCLRDKAADILSDQCSEIVARDLEWTSSTRPQRDARLPPAYQSGDDAHTDSDASEDAEEAAEFAYLMNKIQRKNQLIGGEEDEFDGAEASSDLAAKLMDVVAFQDILASFAALPAVQQLQDFLVHINDELTLLEGYVLRVMSALQSRDETQLDLDGASDFESSAPTACGDDDDAVTDDAYGADDAAYDAVADGYDAQFRTAPDEQPEDADNDTSDDDVAGAFAFAPKGPATSPLTSDALLQTPRRVVDLLVQTTMKAQQTLAAPTLRGSAPAESTLERQEQQHAAFIESLRAMVQNALQDPRQ